jgi:hypothetical protein
VERHDDGRPKKIQRDRQGRVVGFRTADVTVAHNVLIRELYAELEAVRAEVKALAGR